MLRDRVLVCFCGWCKEDFDQRHEVDSRAFPRLGAYHKHLIIYTATYVQILRALVLNSREVTTALLEKAFAPFVSLCMFPVTTSRHNQLGMLANFVFQMLTNTSCRNKAH